MKQKGFEGVWIPAAIMGLDDIGLTEKVILAEIHAFASSDSTFYKTNAQIAEDLRISVTKTTRAIRLLIELGYIENEGFDGRRRHLIPARQIDEAASSKRPRSMVKSTMQPKQIDHAARSKRPTPIKEKKKNIQSTPKIQVVMPWEGFQDVWDEWKAYKAEEHRFKFKSARSELTALKQLQDLSNDDPKTARAIIGQSIAAGWKGLFAIKGSNAPTNSPTEQDANLFANYIRTGRVQNDR